MKRKKVAVLGSTGSIGTQTLNVIRKNPDKLQVVALVAYANKDKLDKQCTEFAPKYSALISRDGEDCLVEAAKYADVVVVATRGIVALNAVLYCLKHNKDVAIANKETLVCGGDIVLAQKTKARIIPVDSEHAAIRQCLSDGRNGAARKILLTASGGPFYATPMAEFADVTPKDALRHPNWSMGDKITIDSATMMNKSLEVLEASVLFGMPTQDIDIVVHRQSIVHSMVEFDDGSVVAQLASPNMELPILQALLGYGQQAVSKRLNFSSALSLTFEPCDFQRFPCAKWGYDIVKYPALCKTVMNAANDECVDAFLQGKLSFTDIYPTIARTVDNFATMAEQTQLNVESIKKFDRIARVYARNAIMGV